MKIYSCSYKILHFISRTQSSNAGSLFKKPACLCVTKTHNITHKASKSAVCNCTQGEDLKIPDVMEKRMPGLDEIKMQDVVCARNAACGRSRQARILLVWWQPHVLQTAESGHQTLCISLLYLLAVTLSHSNPTRPRSSSKLGSLRIQSLSCR